MLVVESSVVLCVLHPSKLKISHMVHVNDHIIVPLDSVKTVIHVSMITPSLSLLVDFRLFWPTSRSDHIVRVTVRNYNDRPC